MFKAITTWGLGLVFVNCLYFMKDCRAPPINWIWLELLNYSPRHGVGWRPTPQVYLVRDSVSVTGAKGGVDHEDQISKLIYTIVGLSKMCACSLHLYFKKLHSHPQPRPSRATISTPLGSFQWVLFSLFPSVGASQAREFQIATTRTPRKTVQTTFCTVIYIFSDKIAQIPCFYHVFACFCNGFLQNSNLHTCRHKTVPKHHVLQYVQFPFIEFSSIFTCCNAAGQLKHIYKKSFQHIVFHSVFYNVSAQKHGTLDVFRHKVGPKH